MRAKLAARSTIPAEGDRDEVFEPLIGAWHGEGVMPIEPPMTISVEATVERLGAFIVFKSVGEPAEAPDSISIIGGAFEGEPQPMYYFDSRGIRRLFCPQVGRRHRAGKSA